MARLDWPEELPEQTRDALQEFFDLDLSEQDRESCVLFMSRSITSLLRLSHESSGYGLRGLENESMRVAKALASLCRIVKPDSQLSITSTPKEGA